MRFELLHPTSPRTLTHSDTQRLVTPRARTTRTLTRAAGRSSRAALHRSIVIVYFNNTLLKEQQQILFMHNIILTYNQRIYLADCVGEVLSATRLSKFVVATKRINAYIHINQQLQLLHDHQLLSRNGATLLAADKSDLPRTCGECATIGNACWPRPRCVCVPRVLSLSPSSHWRLKPALAV